MHYTLAYLGNRGLVESAGVEPAIRPNPNKCLDVSLDDKLGRPSCYAALARTYRPLATRTNSRAEPSEWEASTQLTESPRHLFTEQGLDSCVDMRNPHRRFLVAEHSNDRIDAPAWSTRP